VISASLILGLLRRSSRVDRVVRSGYYWHGHWSRHVRGNVVQTIISVFFNYIISFAHNKYVSRHNFNHIWGISILHSAIIHCLLIVIYYYCYTFIHHEGTSTEQKTRRYNTTDEEKTDSRPKHQLM